MKRGVSAVEKRHYDRVGRKPCLVCGARPVERHHVTALADRRGRLSRRNDRIAPLCAMHHRCGAVGGARHSVEALGHQRFFQIHGVDLMREAERLWNESEAMEARRAA
jgi:hypothetical protein